MVEQLKRPLILKLILVYSILNIPNSPLLLVIYIIALYYGLWKMKREWMWVVVIFLIISTLVHIYRIIVSLNPLLMILVVLNLISIFWLYNNRNIFKKPEKGSDIGTKSEWIRLGIIIFGIIAIILLVLLFGITNSDYIIYGILAIPVWIVFVWFILPKFVKKKIVIKF